MRAKKIGCGSPTCFLNFFPTLEPSKTIPSQRPSTSRVRGVQPFPLQNSDPVFQQGPPAPICVPWFPFVFFVISEKRAFLVEGYLGVGSFWVVDLVGRKSPCSFRRWMDSVYCMFFGWLVGFVGGDELLAFSCENFWRLKPQPTHFWLRIEFILSPFERDV